MGDVSLMGLPGPGMPWDDVLATLKLAEELGYSAVTTGEAWGADAFTTLAQVAMVTSKVRLGTSIVPVFGRTPANMAMAALSLDHLSKGRFFLGLGTSGKKVIEDLHGERFAKPVARMREYIDILRKAFSGDRLDHDGEFFHTSRFRLSIKPYRERLPIYLATLGASSLRMTGELADGWLPIFYAPGRVGPLVEDLRTGAEAAGRTLADIKRSPQVSIFVTRERGAVYEREREHIALYIGGMGVYYHQYMHRIGFGSEADRVREAYNSFSDRADAAALVTDEMVEAMTIIGTPQECQDQIGRYFASGADEVRLVFSAASPEDYIQGLRAVAPG